MSANIVPDAHIAELVNFAVKQRVKFYEVATGEMILMEGEWAKGAGEILLCQNFRSVNAIREKSFRLAPRGYVHQPSSQTLKPVAILKACHGFEYQACETRDWEGCQAWHIIQAIQKNAIRRLDGYNEADWIISPPDEAR